jgi:hypothetical protein
MNYKKSVCNTYSRTRHSKVTPCVEKKTESVLKCDFEPCVSYCVNDGYPSLASVYPPRQCWRAIEDGYVGFDRGTIFSELDKPFVGDKCKNGGKCR